MSEVKAQKSSSPHRGTTGIGWLQQSSSSRKGLRIHHGPVAKGLDEAVKAIGSNVTGVQATCQIDDLDRSTKPVKSRGESMSFSPTRGR